MLRLEVSVQGLCTPRVPQIPLLAGHCALVGVWQHRLGTSVGKHSECVATSKRLPAANQHPAGYHFCSCLAFQRKNVIYQSFTEETWWRCSTLVDSSPLVVQAPSSRERRKRPKMKRGGR